MDAGVTTEGLDLALAVYTWPKRTPAHRRGLMAAVQLLVDEAVCSGWDVEAVVCVAATRGDLALVQYLHGYGPQWAGQQLGCKRAVCAAAEGACEAVLEWVVQQPGCEGMQGNGFTYVEPAKKGDLGTVTALRRLGVPWGGRDVVVLALVQGCHEPGVRWLVEQGAPMGRAGEVEKAMVHVVGCTHWSAAGEEWLRGLVAAAAEGS